MKTTDCEDVRPDPDRQMPVENFERWYWPVEHLKRFCDLLDLQKSGNKAVLRARVINALGGANHEQPNTVQKRHKGSFNWAKETLSRDTIITDTISFGPNLRRFFRAEIGKSFVCHSDFMDWVRNNPGAKLGDAIAAWRILEERKNEPEFRREIAACNNYLQYLRDARDGTRDLSLEDARKCWSYKSLRPAHEGYVVFEPKDVSDAGISL